MLGKSVSGFSLRSVMSNNSFKRSNSPQMKFQPNFSRPVDKLREEFNMIKEVKKFQQLKPQQSQLKLETAKKLLTENTLPRDAYGSLDLSGNMSFNQTEGFKHQRNSYSTMQTSQEKLSHKFSRFKQLRRSMVHETIVAQSSDDGGHKISIPSLKTLKQARNSQKSLI